MKVQKSQFLFAAIVISLIVGSAIAVSSTSDESSKSSETTAYTRLLLELSDYTSDFLAFHNIESRKDYGFGRFMESVKADHIGYSNGSWVGSVGESRKKWKELKKEEQEQQKVDTVPLQNKSMINNQLDSLVSVYKADNSNIGALHNISILKSFIEDDMDFNTTEELVYSIISSVNNLDIEVPRLDVPPAVAEIEDFFENIYDDDVTIMYARIIQRYPERKDELTIQSHYLTSIEALYSIDEVKKYTEGYISIISKSDLSILEKNRIKSNLTIAPASCQLWMLIDSLSND